MPTLVKKSRTKVRRKSYEKPSILRIETRKWWIELHPTDCLENWCAWPEFCSPRDIYCHYEGGYKPH